MANTSTVASLFALVAFLVIQIISAFRAYLARAKIINFHGCKAAKHYAHTIPFLGIDIMGKHKKALEEHRYMENMQNEFAEFGRTWQFTNFGGEIVHTMDPVNLESVMSKDSRNWGVAPIRYQGGEPFLGAGIFTLDGPMWKHARNQVKPALARSQFSNFDILEFHVRRFLDSIPKDAATFDASTFTTRLMIDFSTEYFLGESLHSQTPNPSPKAKRLLTGLDTCLEGTFQMISSSMFFGRLAALIPSSRKFKEACKDVHLFIGDHIRLASKDIEKENGRVVLMNQLVKDTNDERLILSTATTFYSAGTDTSSITISMIIFLLSRHPLVFAKAREEVLAISSGTLDIDAVKRMHFLRAIINETLRLYPVGPTAQRTALNDTVLPTGGGSDGRSPIFVKKGTTFIISYHAMHRDTQIWGKDAADFRPERWERDSPEAWTYQAFGGGLRACPGQQLALAIVGYVLARILQEFKGIESRDDRPWKEGLGLTLFNANGVHVAFTPA